MEYLGNLENEPFWRNVRENLEWSGNFLNIHPSQRKARENELVGPYSIYIENLTHT